MIGKRGLLDLVARAERGALLPGEAAILRDAIDLLDDLSRTCDLIVAGADTHPGYAPETTQQMRVIDDDHGGNRP